MSTGIIKRYDFRKGFGFITDDQEGEDFFFHRSEWQGKQQIRQGTAVTFDAKDSDKGPQAENVEPLNAEEGGSENNVSKKSPVQSAPKSTETRLSELESSVATWKVLSSIALIAVIALAAKPFVV